MGIGSAQTFGQAVTPTSGSAQLACPRGGQLLGFFASATSTVVINDVATVAAVAAGNQKLNASACAVGWNAFPLDFVNGLVTNCGGSVTFIFV